MHAGQLNERRRSGTEHGVVDRFGRPDPQAKSRCRQNYKSINCPPFTLHWGVRQRGLFVCHPEPLLLPLRFFWLRSDNGNAGIAVFALLNGD
jgi:hypothetical protein